MAHMAFAVSVVGHGPEWYGGIDLLFRIDGTLHCYRSVGFTVLGWGAVAEVSSAEPFEIPDHPMLHAVDGRVVRLKLRAAEGFGVVTDFAFQVVQARGNGEGVYDAAPGPLGMIPVRVDGFVSSDLDFVGRMRRLEHRFESISR